MKNKSFPINVNPICKTSRSSPFVIRYANEDCKIDAAEELL